MMERMMFDLIGRMAPLPDLAALAHRLGDQLTQCVLPQRDQDYCGSTRPSREIVIIIWSAQAHYYEISWYADMISVFLLVITFLISRDIAKYYFKWWLIVYFVFGVPHFLRTNIKCWRWLVLHFNVCLFSPASAEGELLDRKNAKTCRLMRKISLGKIIHIILPNIFTLCD